MFNAIVSMEINLSRVAKIPETVYMWCYRPGSASNYTGGDAKRNLSQYRKRIKTIEAFEARGMKYDVKCSAARVLMEYYWELNGKDETPGHTNEEWIRLLQEDVIKRWPGVIMSISSPDRMELYRITKEEAEAKRFIREGMPSLEQWLTEIGAIE